MYTGKNKRKACIWLYGTNVYNNIASEDCEFGQWVKETHKNQPNLPPSPLSAVAVRTKGYSGLLFSSLLSWSSSFSLNFRHMIANLKFCSSAGKLHSHCSSCRYHVRLRRNKVVRYRYYSNFVINIVDPRQDFLVPATRPNLVNPSAYSQRTSHFYKATDTEAIAR